jgi:hypothetical protein
MLLYRYTLSEMMEFKKAYDLQNKRDGAGEAVFSKDAELAAVRYGAGEDNCRDLLHPARWLRDPTSAWDTYAHLVPVRHDAIYKQIRLEELGTSNVVHEKVIGRAHDRAVELRLCMFFKKHYGKRTSAGEELGDSWDNPAEMHQVKVAIQNFAAVYHCLWPRDPAPIVIQKVLTDKYYGENLDCKPSVQAKIVCEFFDSVMLDNASRAARREAPVTVKEAKEKWADTIEKFDVQLISKLDSRPGGEKGGGGESKKGPRARAGTSGAGGPSGSTGNNWKAKPGKKLGGGGTDDRAKCMFNGKRVCYLYNHVKGCHRAKNSDGCTDSKQEFAHVCNHGENGKYCYGPHCREVVHK